MATLFVLSTSSTRPSSQRGRATLATQIIFQPSSKMSSGTINASMVSRQAVTPHPSPAPMLWAEKTMLDAVIKGIAMKRSR